MSGPSQICLWAVGLFVTLVPIYYIVNAINPPMILSVLGGAVYGLSWSLFLFPLLLDRIERRR